MSTEDGPGIRTTIFFKGCSLHCTWCHNPESISPLPQIHWIANRCLRCHTCLSLCPTAALERSSAGIAIDRRLCNGCGKCSAQCPSTALELLGIVWNLDDLVQEVIKDRVYFEKSGGGLTLGGGEPTYQSLFASAFLARLKREGFHTAVDTAGLCPPEGLDRLLPYTDLLLFDLKVMDPGKHREHTGTNNTLILNNLIQVRNSLESKGHPAELWIRTPIIPGATATEDNIRAIGRFITQKLDGSVSRWELCAFNNLCRDKYLRLDLNWVYKDTSLLEQSLMERIAEWARNSGVDPRIVHWSGATRLQPAMILE